MRVKDLSDQELEKIINKTLGEWFSRKPHTFVVGKFRATRAGEEFGKNPYVYHVEEVQKYVKELIGDTPPQTAALQAGLSRDAVRKVLTRPYKHMFMSTADYLITKLGGDLNRLTPVRNPRWSDKKWESYQRRNGNNN